MPIWFLFSYFIVRIGFTFQQSCIRNISPLWLALISLTIPFLLHFCIFRYPYYFANIGLGLFGYCAGYIYKQYVSKYENLVGTFSALLYWGIFIFCPSTVDIRMNKLYSGYYLLWAIWSIAGCAFYLYAFSKVRMQNCILSCLKFDKIGQISMSFLVLHWPILILADFVGHYCLDIPKNCYLLYYLLSIVLFTMPLHYCIKKTKLKFIIGL